MKAVVKKNAVQIGLGLVILVGALAGTFMLNREANASAVETPIPAKVDSAVPAPTLPAPISPAPAAPANAVTIAKAAGTLASASQATLAFQTTGRIKDIKVKQGDQVKAGDVIVALDTAALDAQVTQAQAALNSAMANFEQVKAGPIADNIIIAKSNLDLATAALAQAQAAYDKVGGATNPKISASPQALALQQAYSQYHSAAAQYDLSVTHPTDVELKAAQAAVAQAQATLETAQQNAANARIVAPYNGTIVWIGAKLGESAVAGSPEATIADLTRMQVQVNADEASTAVLQVGQAVSITVDALPGKTLSGQISQIGLLATASGNFVTTLVTVDIHATNAPIYPGLNATVEFQGTNQ